MQATQGGCERMNRALVGMHNTFANRQAQTRAATDATARWIYTEKPVEQSGQGLCGDAGRGIFYVEYDLLAHLRDMHRDTARCVGVA